MQLSEISLAVVNAHRDVVTQQEYVDNLTARKENGDTTIKVLAEAIWSEVNLEQFISLQKDKLDSMKSYAETLSTLEKQLQQTLSTSLYGGAK